MNKFSRFICCVFCMVIVCCSTSNVLVANATSVNTITTSISKVESKAKGFKVTWKKKSKIKGYQVQYSTSSKFKKSESKTKTITKAKTTSATVSKLKGCNKKYYVRVRTYKVVNDKKLYSSWSKAKSVTTLKHKYSSATCTKAKICKYCDKTSGEKLGHKWSSATCTKAKNCIRCKKTSGKALGHIEGKWIVDKVATVTCTGTKHLECSVCGKKIKEETIPATGSVGLKFTVNADGKTCTVTGIGSCKDEEIYIPQYIDGYIVSSIADNAFSECDSVTHINISDTVTTIGSRAFYGCTGLYEITIPKTVTSIGTQVFYKSGINTVYYYSDAGTNSGENVFLNEPSIENVIFGGTTIPYSMCYGCSNLKSITLLDTIKSVESHAFQQCTNLSDVNLGKGVKSLDNSCFSSCTSIKSITIPQSVTYIFQAFYKCEIESVNYLGSLDDWKKIKMYNCGISNGYDLFINGTLLETLVYDDTHTSISGFHFSGSSIKNIVLADSIRSIGMYAFDNCKKITSIFYMGSCESWNNINIECNEITEATCFYYSETQPTQSGNYWRYVNGIPTAW